MQKNSALIIILKPKQEEFNLNKNKLVSFPRSVFRRSSRAPAFNVMRTCMECKNGVMPQPTDDQQVKRTPMFLKFDQIDIERWVGAFKFGLSTTPPRGGILSRLDPSKKFQSEL